MDKRKFFGVFIFFVYIVFGAWILIIYQHDNQTLSSENDLAILESLKQTALRNPINQLVLTDDTFCPLTYDQVPIGAYQGLYKGCSCLNGFTNRGDCEGAQSGCESNEEGGGRNILFWGNEMRVCIKRVTTVHYLTNNGSGWEDQCPSDTKKCNSYTCVGQDEDCPLINIKLVKAIQTTNGKTTTTSDPDLPTGYTKIKEQRDYYIGLDGKTPYVVAVERGSEKEVSDIINNITTIVGGGPCVSPLENPGRLAQSKFSVEKSSREGCPSYGEESKHSTVIDSQDETATYVMNKVHEGLPKILNELIKNNKDQIKLVARRTIPMYNIEQCYYYNAGKIASLQNLLETGYQLLQWIYILFAFFFAVGGVFYIILLCMGDRAGSRIIGSAVGISLIFASILLILQFFMVKDRWETGGEIIDQYLSVCRPIEGVYTHAIDKTNEDARDGFAQLKWMSGVSLAVGVLTLLLHFIFLYNIIQKNPKSQINAPHNFIEEANLIPGPPF